MFWWWDELDRQDAYGHYKPLAAFLKDVSFAGLNPARAIVSKGQLRVLGYRGSDRAYIWLFNPQATWWNLVMEKQQPAEVKNAVVEIGGLTPGGYAVEWWDTFEGKAIASEQVSFTQEGALRIPVRPFSRDVACKVKLITSH
jgi:hypothetical protein